MGSYLKTYPKMSIVANTIWVRSCKIDARPSCLLPVQNSHNGDVPTAWCRLPVAYCLLPTAHCPLPFTPRPDLPKMGSYQNPTQDVHYCQQQFGFGPTKSTRVPPLTGPQ